MSYNIRNKTIVDWFEALSQFEDKDHIDKAHSHRASRKYEITEAVNGRVVILLWDSKETRKRECHYPNRRYASSVEVQWATITAPEWAQITIVWGEELQIDCPENDVRFYKSWDVVTRNNKWKVHAKGCKDITAHQNNLVMVNWNWRAYTKWNNWVLAIWNDELFAFHNDRVVEKESWAINEWHGWSDLNIYNNRPGATGESASI